MRIRNDLGTVLSILFLTLAGCGGSDQRAAKKPIPSESEPAPTSPIALTQHAEGLSPAATVAFDAIGFKTIDLSGQQGIDGWQTESFHDDIQTQLDSILRALVDRDNRGVANLCSDEFRCTPLRPKKLESVFEDDTLQVRRPLDTLSVLDRSERLGTGLERFAQALKSLSAPFSTADRPHGKFKNFRVQLVDEEFANTTAYYEMAGKTAEGLLQQNGTWECRWWRIPDKNPVLVSIELTQYEESLGKNSSGTMFADCTEAVLGANASYANQLLYGVEHWLERIGAVYGLSTSSWQGVTVGDVNGDGLDDIYVCQSGGTPNRLYVQNSDGTATDMSAEAGVDWWDHSHCSLLLDLDNDGDQDLVLSTSLGIILMANDGTGHFEVRGAKLAPEAIPYSLAAADYDNDGNLDIYACCYGFRSAFQRRSFMARPIPYHDANNGGRNILWKNNGRWQFRNVTRYIGLDENNHRFSLAAAWEDYDNDGDMDLYVANDYGRNNLYRNDQGQFVDVASAAGVEDISAGMSVSWGDYNNDGLMDLYVSNMWSSAGNRVTYQRQFHEDANQSTRSDFQRHARGNSLFLNRDDGTFKDVSEREAVTMGRWAWGSRFVDINNDGLHDLLVANGFITGKNSADL